MAAFVLALQREVRRFLSESYSVTVFLANAYAILEKAHREARFLGERSTGDMYGIPYEGILFERRDQRIANEQLSFLRGFVIDLEAGRYYAKSEGGAGAAARKARFQLYANRLVGTANQGWLDAILLNGKQVRWQLGRDEDHCKDCLFEAEQGWRPAYSLTRVPGDGRTVCVTNCRCKLVTEDGLESFHLP